MQSLGKIAAWLNRSPWLNLLSMTVAILGIVLSIYFYLKSKSTVFPRFQTAGVSLLAQGAKEVQGLRILHGDRALERLSVATVSFWNEGTKVLESSAIAAADPLRIVLPSGTTILQVNIGHRSSPSNNAKVTVQPDNAIINIAFDFLSRNDGFTVEIFHDAASADCANVLGTVKGYGSPREVLEGDDRVSENYVRPLFSKLYYLTGGHKSIAFWALSPLWVIPLIFALLFIDLPLRPIRLLLGPSKALNAYKRADRYR